MVSRTEFVDTARRALGTPWVHQGRNVPMGLDCIGLVLWTARQHHITEYEPPPYGRQAKWQQFVAQFRLHLREVPIKDRLPGDILVFRQHIYPCHCGIVTEVGDDPKFIHSYLLRHKVVEERYTAHWKELTVTVFRFEELV